MKKIFLVILISFFSISISAQIKFEAQMDRDTYGLNERFPLVFSINNEGDNFKAPKFTGFKADGPFINKGNEPLLPGEVEEVFEYLSKIWDIPIYEVQKIINMNFRRLISNLK